MTTYNSPTMTRVLAIPELLDMVFQFLDDTSNCSNARVCKQWSEIALDVIWKEVSNIVRLFSLLTPLEKGSHNNYKFVRPLESNDWIRFERYRRRVRKLVYSNLTAGKYVLHHSAFDDIARTRTSLEILPNLQTLHWDASMNFCVMFMHKNVKFFAINILPENVPHVARVFDDIITRMPNLSLIDLRFEFSVKDIEDDVVRVVLGLPNLNRIILPRFCLTNKIAETASQLGKLQTLEYQYYWYQGRGDPADIVDFRPALNEGSFPSLFDLSMTITFRDATNFLSRPFSPPNLTIMYIDSPSIETPSSVLAFLTAIPDACPLLKALTVASYIDPTVTFTSAPEKGDCITIDTLRPLLKCPNLTAFEIEHPYPIHLEPDDVEEIASSWPGVETLVLNTQTTYIEQTNLTLRSLLPFARHCPKLRTLGLFLNATTADFPVPDPDSAYQLPIFRSLRQLSMGVSLIQEEGAVALFLSQLCPLHCEVEWGVTWDMSTEDLEIFGSLQPRFQKWEKVAELLPLLTRLRIEERDRAHLLKKEVQDLRIRTEVLMDKFALSGTSVDGCIAL